MSERPSKVRSFIHEYREAALFLFFLGFGIGYFFIQKYRLPVYFLHTRLDDLIPFCEWFAIPYYIWYLYIALPMIFFFFKYREDFVRLAATIFSGMYVCLFIFAAFPNAIDFRPVAFAHHDLLTWLIQFIYQHDKPTNVCPSLHCYESVAVHIALVNSKPMKGHKVLKGLSLFIVIMICLSTLFIKQHSVIDVICGVLLGIPIYFFVYKPVCRHQEAKHARSVISSADETTNSPVVKGESELLKK